MTIASLYNDLMFFGIFLLIGFFVRELIKPLQKMFLPASLIGGVIALVMGQQVLGVVAVPESFSSLSGTLINVIMAALVFGVTINKKRIASYLDYCFVCGGLYFMQMFVGVSVSVLLLKFWPGLPKGWGIMGLFSFHGGHGTAGSAGGVFKGLGIAENLTVGMVLSTFGLIIAMTVGMVIVNFGIRKGWATFVKEPQKQPSWFYGGALPEEQRKPVGKTVTSSIGINHFALQSCWLFLAAWIGKKLFWLVGFIWPGVTVLPVLMQGIIGAAILWPILCKLKLDAFVDLKAVNQISGMCLEIVVLTAMATLNLGFVATFIVPLLIYTTVCCSLTGIMALLCCRKFCKEEWFEKACMVFGMGTGTTATGLALVRSMDPEGQSCAGDAHGIFSALFCWSNTFVGLTPVWLTTGRTGLCIGIGVVGFVIAMSCGWFFFGRKNI